MRYILLFISMMLVSCTTTKYIEKEVPIEVPVIKEKLKIIQQIDTILQHDSVWCYTYTRGDTVYVEKGRERSKNNIKIQHDTITTNDTITVPVEVKVKDITAQTKAEVERDAWSKTAKMYGYLSLFLLLLLIGTNWKFIKKVFTSL